MHTSHIWQVKQVAVCRTASLKTHSYQAEGEQLGCGVSEGHACEYESPQCNRGPECTAQTTSHLVGHQDRWGHCIDVDEGGIRALLGRRGGGFIGSLLGFYQYKKHELSQILHTAPLEM